MIDLSKFNSLFSLVSYFDTESKCRKVLREQRWGKYVVCPHCGSIRCVERTDGRFHCNDCSANFSELVGTIFGMVEREGSIKAMAVENTRVETLMPIIKRYVHEHSEIFTDELSSYSKLSENGYVHSVVHHHQKEYVVGDSYTNTIEGFWAQFRRMVYGIYHFVSKKYLQRYIDEEVYRWNTKEADSGVRFAYMFGMCSGTFDYSMVKCL